MPPQSTDAADAINRSFEPDENSQPADPTSSNEWVSDCLNDWLNA